jgi:3-oxoacyl-[acyl-carrier protein] reductase/7-alpha-hydroxysteroid dehydrogenase
MLLEGKVAIVTGGSRGIGYAIVKNFLKGGAKVVLCASRQETADKAVAALKAENADYAVKGIWPNLTDYEEVKAAFDGVAAEFGRIDVLVNNAGVSAREPFTRCSTRRWI